jgi:diguanylate cyclase (GGDEF)-like protein
MPHTIGTASPERLSDSAYVAGNVPEVVRGPVDHHDSGQGPPPVRPGGPRSLLSVINGWGLWSLPKRGLVGYVLAVDLVGVLGACWALLHLPLTGSDILPTVALCGCTIAYTELSRPIEKMREQFAGIPHIGLDTVWMFAAVLVVQPALATVVIFLSFFYRWARVQRNPLFRRTFSTTATAVSGYAAVAFLWLTCGHAVTPFATMPRDITTFLLVTAAGLVYLAVNTVLMTVAVYYGAGHTRIRDAMGSAWDYALEGATIALGILLAWALAAWPIALLFIVGITLVLHRSVLIRQLRVQARTDRKTGLLNSESWKEVAGNELDRAGRAHASTSLLMIDLDNFKSINDRFGHLEGDRWLKEVADMLTSEVRGGDLVGRYGGEEFVVLLPETTIEHAEAIAERIRVRIADTAVPLGVNSPERTRHGTVSIGIATSPIHGHTLVDVIGAADKAMYRAKGAGRNRVSLSSAGPPRPLELDEPSAS